MEKKGRVQETFKESHQPVSLASRNVETEISSVSVFFVVQHTICKIEKSNSMPSTCLPTA